MSRQQRKALVCSYNTPQVDRDSGARRVFDTIRMLRESGYAVTFIAANLLGEARYVRDLEQQGIAVYDASSTTPEDLIRVAKFDLAILAFWPVAARFMPVIRRLSPRTRILVDSIDLHFLREARFGLKHGPDGAPAALLDDTYGQRMADEINTYAACDGVLAVSQKETDLINDVVGDPNLAFTVPFGESLPPSAIPFEQRKGVLFVGSFAHQPNVQAIEYFCRDVLPHFNSKIAEAHPTYVVGNQMTDSVRSLGKGLPHVRMVGWVPEVFPYFQQSRITVVPLLSGAGVKGKLVQALMVGTPSVTTSIGIEGMGLRADQDVLIANSPKIFAKAMEMLLTDEKLWKRVVHDGRERIMVEHGWETVAKRLNEVIAEVMTRLAKRALLRHKSPASDTPLSRRERYAELTERILARVDAIVPSGASVAVISKGDDKLLKLGARRTQHFPANARGEYAGHHPADDAQAIHHLEAAKEAGAAYLVVPSTSFWWFEHYREFGSHLARYETIAKEEDVRIFALGKLGKRRAKSTSISSSSDAASAPVVAPARKLMRATRGSIADDVRLIAFYLPQFHPIPENDRWWGRGFTEWTNVSKAQPLFDGHYQPHLPADLGFYDLRLPDARQAQADLAKECGVNGFCYYHYWFGGKRLLEQPFNAVLESGKPDLPFCLCWANEPWSRRWDGSDQQILQPQTYSFEDDLAHMRALMPALRDPRAIRVGGKPLFMVYQGRELPDPARTIEIWRDEIARAGLPGIYLIAVETGWDAEWDATQVGFDAKVLFQPQFSMLKTVPRENVGVERLHVFSYDKAWPVLANPKPVSYRRYDAVFPSWDNCARRGGDGWVVHNSTPDAYEQWLGTAINRAREFPRDERLVFINAWNEWAEGAHLEPDMKHGRAYLEATLRARSLRAPARRPSKRAGVV